MLILAALLTACVEDTSDVSIGDPIGCGEGFGRGDDGNCYPLEALDTGASWGVVDVTCAGDATYYATAEVTGPAVSAWGDYTAELIDLCETYSTVDDCFGYYNGANGEPVEVAAAPETTSATVLCERFRASGDGEEWIGFYTNPIHVYYIAD